MKYSEFESRRLIGNVQLELNQDKSGEPYLDKLLKLIPLEVVTLYVTLKRILDTNVETNTVLNWVVVFVCFLGILLYQKKFVEAKYPQIFLSCVAFFVWVFALGGPFEQLEWYRPLHGALLLPTFTFFTPFLVGSGKAKSSV